MIHWQDLNLEPTAWASNSGEKIDHSATGHSICKNKELTKYCMSKNLGDT